MIRQQVEHYLDRFLARITASRRLPVGGSNWAWNSTPAISAAWITRRPAAMPDLAERIAGQVLDAIEENLRGRRKSVNGKRWPGQFAAANLPTAS